MPSSLEAPSRSASLSALGPRMSAVFKKARSTSLLAEKQKQKFQDGLNLLRSLSAQSKTKLLKATSSKRKVHASTPAKDESLSPSPAPRPTTIKSPPTPAETLYDDESTMAKSMEVPPKVVESEVVVDGAEPLVGMVEVQQASREMIEKDQADLSGGDLTNESTIPADSSPVGTEPVLPTGTMNGSYTATNLEEWDSLAESSWGFGKVLRWSFIIGVVAVAVSFYCGDIIKNPNEALTTYKGMLPPFRVVSGWRSMTMPWPVETPALERGSVLRSGDFIFSCRPAAEKDQACQPTIFHLHDDGRLTLSRGSSPNNIQEDLWSSKKIAPAGEGEVTALYEADGSLSVRQGDKAFYRKSRMFVPKGLKPWPLSR